MILQNLKNPTNLDLDFERKCMRSIINNFYVRACYTPQKLKSEHVTNEVRIQSTRILLCIVRFI